MSLRGQPLEQTVKLPDGRVVAVRVGIAEDSYIQRGELDTVVLELWDESRGEHLAGVSTVLSADDVDSARSLVRGEHLAGVSTVLSADDVDSARSLVREVVAGLGDGSLAPTAGALEPLADSVPPE